MQVRLPYSTRVNTDKKVFCIKKAARQTERLLRFFHFYHRQGVVLDGEADLVFSKPHTVQAVGVVLVGRPRVVGKALLQACPFFLGDFGEKLLGKAYAEGVSLVRFRITCRGFRMAIGEGQVGLDIENGSSVQQVRSRNDEDIALVGSVFYAYKLYAGQAYGVGAKGGTAGENAHAGIAAEPRRTDGGRPFLSVRSREIEQQPKMGKALDAAYGVGVLVFGQEYDFGG